MKKRLVENGICLPYNTEITDRAKQLRKHMTESERKLWFCYLKDCNIRFYRQKQVDSFIVDFYCSKAKLAIEVDGESHTTDDAIGYDIERTKILESYGIKVIRVTNHDIKYKFQEVCKMIEQAIPSH